MCGRINITDSEEIQDFFAAYGIDFKTTDNPDLCPSQEVAVLAYIDGEVRQLDTRWGIKPAWSKRLLINAQGETVASKKTFRDAFREHRCLVPCSGWYEWRDEGGPRKQKYAFTRKDGKPFLMCGIWYEGQPSPELVTLTTRPTQRCAEIHNRMPALIDIADRDVWFYDTEEDAERLLVSANDDQILIKASD